MEHKGRYFAECPECSFSTRFVKLDKKHIKNIIKVLLQKIAKSSDCSMSETEQKLNSSEFVASSMTYLHNMEEDKYVEQSNCVQQKKESHIEQVG